MNQRVAIVPDLNHNEAIEGIANTIGAYTGAGVTAIVGGLGTLLNGLFRGAVAGAQQTYANAGAAAIPVVNTSQARQQVGGQAPAQRQFALSIAAPAPTAAPQTVTLSDEELAVIQGLRAGTLKI